MDSDGWDKHPDEATRHGFLTHTTVVRTINEVKREGLLTQHENVDVVTEDAKILLNLRCPTLGDFRWYRDIFLTKLMTRTDCALSIWKELFVHGLPNYFSQRVIYNLMSQYSGYIQWDSITYGELSYFIINEGLKLCNEVKLMEKYTNSRSGKAELDLFYEQYGPSSSKRRTSTRIFNKSSRPPRVVDNQAYQKKPFQRKWFDPRYQNRFQCNDIGHYANKCLVCGKIK